MLSLLAVGFTSRAQSFSQPLSPHYQDSSAAGDKQRGYDSHHHGSWIPWFLHTRAFHTCCVEQLHASVLPRASFCRLTSLQLSLCPSASSCFASFTVITSKPPFGNRCFYDCRKTHTTTQAVLINTIKHASPSAFCSEPSSRHLMFTALITSVSPVQNPSFPNAIVLIGSYKGGPLTPYNGNNMQRSAWFMTQMSSAWICVLSESCSRTSQRATYEPFKVFFFAKTLIQSDTEYLHLGWVWYLNFSVPKEIAHSDWFCFFQPPCL